jgi:hypothetical protein
MSSASRILTVAAISLLGATCSVSFANASVIVDCIYQVTPAGNGHTVYQVGVATLTPDGTLTTGQQFDLRESAVPATAPDGDSVIPEFPQGQHMEFPVKSAAGTVLMAVFDNQCVDDSQ